jgi:uncharacterized cupredoxin-like copper-binding protein
VIPRIALAAALSVALIAGCGDDDESGSTTAAVSTVASTTAEPTTSAPTTTGAPASEATPTTSANTAATAATPTEPPTTSDANEVLISVTVGVDSSPERVEPVPLGSTVTLEMTDPNADQEYHIHVYDLGGNAEVPAGTTARFTFVADRAGEFEVESHITDDVLVVLEVS